MKVRINLLAVLLVLSSSSGSLGLLGNDDGTDPLVNLSVPDPYKVEMHDESVKKGHHSGHEPVTLQNCPPLDKQCWAQVPSWSDLPEFSTSMSSQEACNALRSILDQVIYGLLEETVCDADKEPGPDPGPIPDLPITIPSYNANADTDHYLGFDGIGLDFHAALDFAMAGFGFDAEVEGNSSVRISGESPPPAEPGQVPCQDPRGCPDLLVDETRLMDGSITEESFETDDCAVVEGATKEGDRRLLRFTFATPNLGRGDLIVGAPDDNPQWFEWGECHGHWHFISFADFRLWTIEGYLNWMQVRADDPDAKPNEIFEDHPHLEDELVTSHKQGFCLMDVRSYLPFSGANYRNCNSDQGISVGWADEYHQQLDGQWVDITDAEPGMYVLEAEVNPDRLFQESDYTNNAAAVFMPIPPTELFEKEELECDDCLPDLTVDKARLLSSIIYSSQTFREGNCNIEEGNAQEGDRTLIRFTTKVSNIGNASLGIGNPEDNPDLYEWGECHAHWHFIDFADQRVWNLSAYHEWQELREAEPERPAEDILDDHPHLRDGMVGGHKQGFCLIDIESASPVGPDTPSHHRSCSNQGISAGWADVYGSNLDGQFVDITDIPTGLYVLELEVNPGRTIEEARYDNNAVAVLVPVP